jgi:hypothetical protein
MVVKKISELVPKGAPLGNTDLLVVGVDNGFDYDLKSVTGAQLLGNVVSQTITNGDTSHSPSSDVVFDSLALKVDKITGKGLSTEDYTSAEKTKLSGLTGTNTGDQTLQTVTSLGNSTTQQLISSGGVFFKTVANQTLSALYSTDSNTKGALLLGDLIGNSTYYKPNEITVNSNSILLPSSAGTLALTSDLITKVTSNTAITGATKTKITYDSKGLVTSGADATTSDIADSLNKRYVTDANLTVIGNTSGTNTGDQTISDATITTTDITTNNFTTAKHGFVPKGTNTGKFLKDDGTWGTPSAGGLTYFSEAQSTTAPNTTVYANSLTAISTTTNADFVILPKGTGAFIVGHIPDGNGVVGGGKRGNYAVDIQPGPLNYYAGASGIGSIAIGYQNEATGNYSTAIGTKAIASGTNAMSFVAGANNRASGSNSLLLGTNGDGNCTASGASSVSISGGYATGANSFAQGTSTASGISSVGMSGGTASGLYSFAVGESNIADARSSVAFGMYGATKGVAQRLSLGSFQDVIPYLRGNSQLSISSTVATTTTNTAIELVAYQGTAINLVLQNNEAIRVKGSIIGKQTASTNVACYDFDCVVVRGTTAASTILPLSNVNLVLDTITLETTPTLTANTSSGGLSVKSGAKTTTTIKWSCRIDSTEVILA